MADGVCNECGAVPMRCVNFGEQTPSHVSRVPQKADVDSKLGPADVPLTFSTCCISAAASSAFAMTGWSAERVAMRQEAPSAKAMAPSPQMQIVLA